LLKDPGASLDYGIDWGADWLDGASLSGSTWTVEPVEPGGLAVEASAVSAGIARVTVRGGIAGRIYRLINAVQASTGRQDRRALTIRVEAR
jgi:hypothetical protein